MPQQQPELAAADVAAILRCLAAAERLPGMNYSSLCRRLLRTHSSAAEVEEAAEAFVAAQSARQQQQYHLSDLTAELLAEHSLAAAPPAALRHRLHHLPQLLAALPEAQAVAALQAACQHVCSAAASSEPRQWAQLLPLLGSLERLLSASSSANPPLQQAAQLLLAEAVLPALPVPGPFPLQPGLLLTVTEEQLPSLSVRQQCWAAALRCLQRLPREQLESALRQPALLQHLPMHAAAAAAALVAAGTLDAAALQHPRNLLLAGSRMGESQRNAVALAIGGATASLPTEQQEQWLLSALDACKVRGRLGRGACDVHAPAAGVLKLLHAPLQPHLTWAPPPPHVPRLGMQACASSSSSLQLSAAIADSSAAACLRTTQLAAEHVLCCSAGGAALPALPAALPLLLGSATWQRGGSGHTALLLQRLVAALEHTSGSGKQPAADEQAVRRGCVLGARAWLPADLWPLLSCLLL